MMLGQTTKTLNNHHTRHERRIMQRRQNHDRREMIRFEPTTCLRRSCRGRRKDDTLWDGRDRL